MASDFQIAPKDTGLQKSIISVGQVCDNGNIITFRSTGGTRFNEFTGNSIEFERAGGVYRLRADTRAKMKSETVGVSLFMGLEQDTAASPRTKTPAGIVFRKKEFQVEQFWFRVYPSTVQWVAEKLSLGRS